MSNIVIKKSYFDNIKTAIDSINAFFSSGFKNKNFPVLNENYQLDVSVQWIISQLNNVEPSWIDDPNKIADVLNLINRETEGMTGDIYTTLVAQKRTAIVDYIQAFIGFRTLQKIADNFDDFNTLINGIYTFELFADPIKYRQVIDVFKQDLQFDEIGHIFADSHIHIFDVSRYVNGLFGNNEQITFPQEMNDATEINRINGFMPLQDVEISVDDAVQEAATVNLFEDVKPDDIRYDTKTNKWLISKQFEKTVNDLVAALKDCDTTEDLANYFSELDPEDPGKIAKTVIPYIYSNVFINKKKFGGNMDNQKDYQKYIESYKSITDKNAGAKRFIRYDIFSTFKTDKDGTIKFIEDFLKLNLVNNDKISISNNTLLTLFNIFDSRIYLDIMYNVIPESVKKDSYPSEDEFVKQIRARINKNSRNANPYAEDNTPAEGNETPTTEEIKEYAINTYNQFGDLSLTEMMYCEQYTQAVYDEINAIGDMMYNKGISPIAIDKYIGESRDIFYTDSDEEVIQEQETGEIPDYIANRIKLTDETNGKPNVTVTDVQLPPDIPLNPIDDLVDSIDTKLSVDGGLDESLGVGYTENPNKKKSDDGKIVYNITNNYNNSFNKTSDDHSVHNTTNTNTTTNNDLSTNKTVTHVADKDTGKNNNNNSNDSNDSTDTEASAVKEYSTFESGYTIDEVFTFLESAEPPSERVNAGKPPKGDLLTAAMDADRKSLSHLQSAKQHVQKAYNTARAGLKPVSRTKQFLTKIVDSIIKRDEDKVKAQIIENKSYRTAIYKATRIAIKIGAFGVLGTIWAPLAAVYTGKEILRIADKDRLKKEVQEEFLTEIRIIDEKIHDADSAGDKTAKYQLMRQRSKLESIVGDARRSKIRHPNSLY